MRAYISGIDILGEETKAIVKSPTKIVDVVSEISIKDVVLPLIGVIAGYYVGKKYKHEWLGTLAGGAVGMSAPHLYRKEYAKAVPCLAAAATGIGASLLWKKHPALGYGAGAVAGGSVAEIISK
jgi:hypothetical protein